MSNNQRGNSGFINFRKNDDDGTWAVGGSFTTAQNEEMDLGYCKTGSQNVTKAIELIAAQIGPTIAGKGIHREERRNGQNGGNNRRRNNNDEEY